REGLRLQGGGGAPQPVGEDDRDPRLRGAPQAPALEPPPAHRLGQRAPPHLSDRFAPHSTLRPNWWRERGVGPRSRQEFEPVSRTGGANAAVSRVRAIGSVVAAQTVAAQAVVPSKGTSTST